MSITAFYLDENNKATDTPYEDLLNISGQTMDLFQNRIANAFGVTWANIYMRDKLCVREDDERVPMSDRAKSVANPCGVPASVCNFLYTHPLHGQLTHGDCVAVAKFIADNKDKLLEEPFRDDRVEHMFWHMSSMLAHAAGNNLHLSWG